ncbi:unnamed protein product [Orchesella dallaii]|uniref:Uncharacterized protein n=1 Tax=Orchesella dallaii TaxID=48710 RepID=A0ABP1QDG4_9HEXA
MALILLFRVGMALSVLLWYGAAVLRFVNDFFHHQFLKQLEEEYMQHPELRNLDVLQSRSIASRAPRIYDYADEESKISGVGGNSGGISLDGIVAKDENDNPKISKMDSEEDELPDAFSIHPDHHYHSILIPSQSGGQGRDQKPQSGFTEGEWISMAEEDTEDTDFSMNHLHDYDYYYNYHDHHHHVGDDDDDAGDGPPSNRYFPESSCGVGVANEKDTDIRWVTSSADLSKVEHLDHILENHDAYCSAPSEETDHNIELDDRMDSVDDDYDRYADFHKYVDEQLRLNEDYKEDLDSSHYFKTHFGVSSASSSSSSFSILSKVLLVKLIWW